MCGNTIKYNNSESFNVIKMEERCIDNYFIYFNFDSTSIRNEYYVDVVFTVRQKSWKFY